MNSSWEVVACGELTNQWWQEWDALNDAHHGGHPALSSPMARNLLKYFSAPESVGATLRAGSGVLVKALLEPCAWGRWRVVAPGQCAIALLVFDRAANAPADWLRALLRSLPKVGLELMLPRQDPLHSWVTGSKSSLLHSSPYWTTIAIHPGAGFDDYWAQRPKELKDNIRRRARRAEQDGVQTRLVMVHESSEVGAAVDRYGGLESGGWKGKEGTALHPTNRQGAFYREMLCGLAARGGARVYELYLNDQLAASRLVVSGPTMHIVLKTAHDEELRQYAVGHLQLYQMLQQMLVEPQARPLELYMNASRDWLLWATHQRAMEQISLYRNGLVERAVSVRRAMLRRAEAAATKEPSSSPDQPRAS